MALGPHAIYNLGENAHAPAGNVMFRVVTVIDRGVDGSVELDALLGELSRKCAIAAAALSCWK